MKAKGAGFPAFWLPAFLLFLLILSSCVPLLAWWGENNGFPRPGLGAAVVSHRGVLYFLGGFDSADRYSDSVGMTRPAGDGTILEWSFQTPLPSARAFHSVAAYGEYLYLIGGKDETGWLDDIWYAYINPDGTLGSRWMRSDFALPSGRAAAAAFILADRIYLAGGEGSDGETEAILSARIWRDGRLGLWGPVSKRLPSPRSGAAALCLGNKVYIAGGKYSSSYFSDFLAYEILEDGKLGEFTKGPALPDPRAFSALVPEGDLPVLVGGQGPKGGMIKSFILSAGGVWESKPSFDGEFYGPAALLRGYAFMPKPVSMIPQLAEEGGVGAVGLSRKATEAPTSKPAGGLVKKGSTVALFAAPDEVIRFTVASGGVEPPDPDGTSAIYDPSNGPAIGAASILKARSFLPEHEPSGVARFVYVVDGAGFIFTIEKRLRPSTEFNTLRLQETYSDGSALSTSVIWLELIVLSSGYFGLEIRDKDDVDDYSDSVNASLFEGPSLSLLSDVDDVDIYNRRSDSIAYLAPGSYFLRIASTSGTKGGTFGIRFSRQD